jgi:GrpB-like predicted nucleotidyltransferase (UPF0157 family)
VTDTITGWARVDTAPAVSGSGATTISNGTERLLIEPYHASWPGRFRVESEVLRTALSTLEPSIEHVGSTAVPGLASKPIIDILAGVQKPSAIDGLAERLRNFGYVLVRTPEHSHPDRRLLVRSVRGTRTHHVHVVEMSGELWERIIHFRDLLRADAQLAADYAAMKKRVSVQFGDNRSAYLSAKASFIEAALHTAS